MGPSLRANTPRFCAQLGAGATTSTQTIPGPNSGTYILHKTLPWLEWTGQGTDADGVCTEQMFLHYRSVTGKHAVANVHTCRPSECKSLGADPEVGIDNVCFSSLYVKYRTEDQLRDDFQKVFSSALGAKVVSVLSNALRYQPTT